MENVWRERTQRIRNEIEDCRKVREIETCTTQIESCLELLIPPVEIFLSSDSSDIPYQSLQQRKSVEEMRRENGMVTRNIDIAVDVPSGSTLLPVSKVPISQDNCYVIENLKDQYKILRNRLLPKVKKWMITLAKAGVPEASEILKKVIDIKEGLEKLESKVESLEIIDFNKEIQDSTGEDSEENESDFEEVPEKEGYEEFSKMDTPDEDKHQLKNRQKVFLPGTSTPTSR